MGKLTPPSTLEEDSNPHVSKPYRHSGCYYGASSCLSLPGGRGKSTPLSTCQEDSHPHVSKPCRHTYYDTSSCLSLAGGRGKSLIGSTLQVSRQKKAKSS